MSALLPCPFCGGEAEIYQIGNDVTPKRGFEVKCMTWGCATKKRAMVIRQPIEMARAFATAAWNRRATPTEARSASPWRDIESAPWEPAPGEQWMLLWNGHWRGVGRRWAGYDGDPGFCDETTEFITPEPTHWLPLPAPPKAEAPAEARSEQAEVSRG